MSRRFQFSLRLMLVAIGAVAVAVWSLVVTPSWLACIAMDWVAAIFATTTLIACIQTTGIVRTFWVGAFVPVIFACVATILGPVWFFAAHEPEWDYFWDTGADYVARSLRYILPFLWSLAPLNGLLCALVHRLVWPRPTEREL